MYRHSFHFHPQKTKPGHRKPTLSLTSSSRLSTSCQTPRLMSSCRPSGSSLIVDYERPQTAPASLYEVRGYSHTQELFWCWLDLGIPRVTLCLIPRLCSASFPGFAEPHPQALLSLIPRLWSASFPGFAQSHSQALLSLIPRLC